MYVEHNKPNWDKLQAISVLTSDSPTSTEKEPIIYIYKGDSNRSDKELINNNNQEVCVSTSN